MYPLRKGYEVDVTVSYVDDAGAPASVQGAPTWVIADPTVMSITPAPDGMSALLRGTGDVIGSTTRLSVEADADLGECIVPILVTEELQLISGQATTASFGFGEPRPTPAAVEE